MIKYIGSKRVLVPTILDVVRSIPEARSAVDFFSGTSRVGHALKRAGYRVIANDWMAYAHTLATCYVQSDAGTVAREAAKLVAHFNTLPGREGYFTETFCRQSRFFQPKNGARVDAIRDEIEQLDLGHELRAVLLVSLMEAADRVDSTTGVQMAYLKSWAPRAFNDLELRVPDILDQGKHGRCSAHGLEAQEAANLLEADLAYIDPPYNQHSYLGNYHVWESLIRWDKPDVYGVACKRVDCRTRKSDFNSKRRFQDAFVSFIGKVKAKFLVVSFNNEGYIAREDMEQLLQARGDVYVVERDHKRYVGAQIGIHNPKGELVGAVSHLRNKEFLYVVVPTGYEWSPEAFHQVPAETPLLFADM
jgi:adenine-specific DNA-methyltransferase